MNRFLAVGRHVDQFGHHIEPVDRLPEYGVFHIPGVNRSTGKEKLAAAGIRVRPNWRSPGSPTSGAM
jgi:hypothetical protein